MHETFSSADTPASRKATRLAFFIPGFGIACWAPLVPFVKTRVGADEAELGMLLLCLGLGSVIAMPLAAAASARSGSRKVIISGAILTALVIPLLASAPSTALVAAALLLFGAAAGAMDVAANIHGTEVQNAAGVSLMSNFHGLYSVGGLAGSLAMTLMLSAGLGPSVASGLASAVILVSIAFALPGLLRTRAAGDAPLFAVPRGIILLIGILAFVMFLVEGAMLDWSAVLLSDFRNVDHGQSGAGYVLFSLAMAIARLTGDRIVGKFGSGKILLFGSLLTCAGILLPVMVNSAGVSLLGFFIVGLGAANLVPVLFTATGQQKEMPKDLAIAAVSVMGYAGILCGPAVVGFVAKATSLPVAFGMLAAGVLSLAVFSSAIARINR